MGNRALPIARTVVAFLAASLLTACDSAMPTGPGDPAITARPSADLGAEASTTVEVMIQADSVSSIYAVAYEEPPASSEGAEGSSEP